MIFLNFGLVWN